MWYVEKMHDLAESQRIEEVLKRDLQPKEAVRALQILLHDLGFDAELKYAEYGADGQYGGGTVNAVKTFADKNGLAGNGQVVTQEIAARMMARHDILDELRHLNDSVRDNKVEQLIFRNSPHSAGVAALQTLLNELGFGEELNWQRYGADGNYGGGTARAVRAFAAQEGLPGDGSKLTSVHAARIIAKLERYFGDDWAADTQSIVLSPGLTVREAVSGGKTRVYVSDGDAEKRFTRFRKGIYTIGDQKAIEFINANRSTLASFGLTDSAVNVIVSVSENEGNLDAINTWDNSFMTFGMFQWTVGSGGSAGELPALLWKITKINEDVFDKYFRRHGIDIANTGDVTGYLTFNGRKIAKAADKEMLRSPQWAFRFWRSGQDPLIQLIEIQHAFSRLERFYRSARAKVKGYFISDLVTSEYGVALILDNHVNRPGHIVPILEKAMDRTGLSNPGTWDTSKEQELIEAYLSIRETHGRLPMTNARKRAEVTTSYLTRGIISDERGSFQWHA